MANMDYRRIKRIEARRPGNYVISTHRLERIAAPSLAPKRRRVVGRIVDMEAVKARLLARQLT